MLLLLRSQALLIRCVPGFLSTKKAWTVSLTFHQRLIFFVLHFFHPNQRNIIFLRANKQISFLKRRLIVQRDTQLSTID